MAVSAVMSPNFPMKPQPETSLYINQLIDHSLCLTEMTKRRGRGHWGHRGRKGKRGGSLPSKGAPKPTTRAEENLPKMPRIKTTGTLGEVQDRAKVRAKAMEEKYGGDFSRFVPNPLGIKQGKKKGMWWSDLPQAIYRHKTTKPLSTPRVERAVEAAFEKWRFGYDYVSFNTLKFGSGLSFEEVFGYIRARQDRDPRSVKFTVNRLNDPVHVSLVRKKKV